VLTVALAKRLAGFALDVQWEAPEPVVALVGPTGSGKTLTLHGLAGLVRPDRGRIALDDRVLFDTTAAIDRPTRARRLGYVFQIDALFPHLSVRDNVAFGLDGWPAARRRERTEAVIARLGLGGLQGRDVRDLPGEQRLRVALGRALAPDPDLLLLDEPLAALGAPLRRRLCDDLVRIIREAGKTTVVATDDLSEAYQLADRVIVYEEGRVLQSAPKSELLWRPASERVARIMGMRNVLRGTVLKASSDRIQLRWRGQTLEAVNSPSHTHLPPPGSAIAFFIRPEYVRLVRKDRGTPDPHHMNLMRGTLVSQTDCGTIWTLAIRLDEPGPPAQGDHDLEVEVPRLVHEILELDRDHHWEFSIHRGSIQVLPA
jgi:molybdate transport system ATP-binding protein